MKREDFILPVHAEERKRTKKNTESTFSNFKISDDIVNLARSTLYIPMAVKLMYVMEKHSQV